MEELDKLKNIPLEDLNSIKLIKNTKGYQWEVKIYCKNEQNILNRIKNIDYELNKTFGL